MALPEYDVDADLLRRTRETGERGLSIYLAPREMVVLGRGSKPDVELDLLQIERSKIPVYRRKGGGCAVLLDPGNVIVSLTAPIKGIGGSKRHFAAISRWLSNALASLGIPGVEQRGISDLALGDRKIGGSCIYRGRDLLYYSTTLLVAPDIGLMDSLLSHPPREPDYRRGRSHADFVGSLDGILGGIGAAGLVRGLAGELDPARLRL